MDNFICYDSFINRYGEKFDNIRNIAFSTKNNYNFGIYKNQTMRTNGFFGHSNDENEGVYIFQTTFDKNKALRIFKDFKDINSEGILEDRLVSHLIECQPNVKLTDFPTGVVTLDNRVIGHEIVFYPEALNVCEYYTNNNDDNDKKMLPTEIYKKILVALSELLDNGIAYFDIHNKNFMVLNDSNDIKIIDFEKMQMEFGEYITSSSLKRMISNFRIMVKRTNELAGISSLFPSMPNFVNLDEGLEIIDDMHNKLIRIK